MIAPVGIVVEICLQEILEKENFQDNKHDEKLDQDHQPNLFAPTGKIGKSIKVKPEGTFKYIHNFGL